MRFRRKVLFTAAALLIAGVASAEASTAAENRQFNAIVQSIVQGYDNEALREMTSRERREWNACVVRIFSGVPQGKKREVLAASGRSEQKKRLDKISQEDHAAVRQQITRECPI